MSEFAPILDDPCLFIDWDLNRTTTNAVVVSTKLTPVLYAAVIQETLNSREVPAGAVRTYEPRDGVGGGIAKVKKFRGSTDS
jgi:hypothetical protein